MKVFSCKSFESVNEETISKSVDPYVEEEGIGILGFLCLSLFRLTDGLSPCS